MNEYEWPAELDTDNSQFRIRYITPNGHYKDEYWTGPRPFTPGVELEHFGTRFIVTSVSNYLYLNLQVVHMQPAGPALH